MANLLSCIWLAILGPDRGSFESACFARTILRQIFIDPVKFVRLDTGGTLELRVFLQLNLAQLLCSPAVMFSDELKYRR